MAKLTEKAKTKEKTGSDDSPPGQDPTSKEAPAEPKRRTHKPQRLRKIISGTKSTNEFGPQMRREATRRKFDAASRQAFVADGLTCNWSIHTEHFADYVPFLDFTQAVSYLFMASIVYFGKIVCLGTSVAAWESYVRSMRLAGINVHTGEANSI